MIIDNAEVVALCDTSEKSIKESLDLLNNEVAIFDNYIDLVEANIADAFIIATPNFTHIEVLKDVMKSEAHLLIEKPLCTTVKDCQEFEKLAVHYPGVIWTAMEYRYMPPVQRMIKEIHNKTIGDLKMLSIREHRFPFLHKVDDWNRFAERTGGTLVEKCCHYFNLMDLVIGQQPIRVFASGGQSVNHLDEKYDGKGDVQEMETKEVDEDTIDVFDFDENAVIDKDAAKQTLLRQMKEDPALFLRRKFAYQIRNRVKKVKKQKRYNSKKYVNIMCGTSFNR